MSVIQPRTRGKRFVRLIVRLDVENEQTLRAYAAFLDEPVDYIVDQLVETVLVKDRAFLRWREDHPQSSSQRSVGPVSSKKAGTPPRPTGGE